MDIIWFILKFCIYVFICLNLLVFAGKLLEVELSLLGQIMWVFVVPVILAYPYEQKQ